MKEIKAATGKDFVLYTYICAVDEAKKGDNDKALQTGVVAVAGALVCIQEGDNSCMDLLDNMVYFMDRVATSHSDKMLSEQRMLDALSMILSRIDEMANNDDTRMENAKVRYLFRAMIACEQLDQGSLAMSYETKALSVVRNLRRNKALTCWLEYSKLCMHRSVNNISNTDASLPYAQKAYRISCRGCRNISVHYRNKCYEQMMESSGFLESAYDVYQQKRNTYRWRVCFLKSLLLWKVSNIEIALIDSLGNVSKCIKNFFTKYGWRLLQLICICWLGWLIYIIVQHLLIQFV